MQEPYSIIIPTLNEEEHIVACLQNVKTCLPNSEIIVVDGGSTDNTPSLVKEQDVRLLHSLPGRGKQCRTGAEAATRAVFIFLHVDSVLSVGTLDSLNKEFLKPNLSVATFSVLFDGDRRRYRVFEWCAQFECIFTTYGDQGIIVTKDFYINQVSMPDMELFEDVEFFKQARKLTKITKLNIPIKTSVRRFENKGFWRVKTQNCLLMLGYSLGVGEKHLYRLYYAKK